jgi:predicted MFS family arabinose efflux permease
MNQDDLHKIALYSRILCAVLFVLLSVFLFLNRVGITLTPWNSAEAVEDASYAGGNGKRTAVIEGSEKSIVILDAEKKLILRMDAASQKEESFSSAKFVSMDAENNLYILDADFGGAYEDNTERVLKYSPKGVFLEEVYSYRYKNENFITTKGKTGGMAYFDGALYLVLLEDNGIRLEQVWQNKTKESVFITYPHAFRDLVYAHINPGEQQLTVTAKTGGIKQYDFSGVLVYDRDPAEGSLPWTAVSGNRGSLIYTDILANKIVSVDIQDNRETILFTPETAPYYRINYEASIFFAVSRDNILAGDGTGNNMETISSYSYHWSLKNLRIILFAGFVLDLLLGIALLILFLRFLINRGMPKTLRLVLTIVICVSFGLVLSSVLIINEMGARNNENSLTNLENVSRLIAASVDADALKFFSSPAQYDGETYRLFRDGLKKLFTQSQFNGERVYQAVRVVRNGMVYGVYDLEDAEGLFYPVEKYTADSFYKKVFDTGSYVYSTDPGSNENSLFTCGPIFDRNGEIVALIETGLDTDSVQRQTRGIILRTILFIAASVTAVFIIIALFTLILKIAKKKGGEKNSHPLRVQTSQIIRRAALAGPLVFAALSVFLFLNKNMISLTPWNTTEAIEWPNYAGGNGKRIAVAANSEASVLVLNSANELVSRVDAKPNSLNSFSRAEATALDENNNIYILDKNFGGAFEENTERVLKFSAAGKFIGEVYAYRYRNEDFIITKGKISGMAYFEGAVYVVRLGGSGFYLERSPAVPGAGIEEVVFFDYPNAFRDLTYARINAGQKRLVVATNAGTVKQYDFSGNIIGEWPAEDGALPYTVISDDNNNLIYTDILSGEMVLIDTVSNERTLLFAAPEAPYYYINYAGGSFFAAGSIDVLTMDKEGEKKNLDSYSYPRSAVNFRIALFAACILDILVFLVSLISLIVVLSKKKMNGTLKRILLAGVCVAFGAGISSVFIIREMNLLYIENTYNTLENVCRLTAASIEDLDAFTSIDSPVLSDSEEYLRAREAIKAVFSKTQFSGEQVYQYIWIRRGDTVYSMYDLESAFGALYPFGDYEGSDPQKVYDSKEYIHTSDITSTGGWIFTNGPIFDQNGEVAAVIETGYNMDSFQEQNRRMVIQTSLIVIAAAVAFLLLMIEFIIISNAYKKNKAEWREDEVLPFRPELLRAITFFNFIAGNLATALLPMYAANLYQPLFNLPREFVVTLPFTTDLVFAALALLVIPVVLKRIGTKRISLMAVLLLVIGYMLCFAAVNTVFLAAAYACIGFAGGALILVLNTIIGAQRDVKDVNSGFAHFNASYLAGINVGVVFGSTMAQFFPYRLVYLFSLVIAVLLFVLIVFSTRSKYLRHIYDITKEEPVAFDYQKEEYLKKEKEKKFALVKFIFSPVVLGTLLLLLLPYQVASGFTNYFMPIFGTGNGLGESNIGQLILLSGLFAILFGTSLCEYLSKKLPLKAIITIALLLNIGGIYLFSLNVSVPMLIAAVVILAIANIFVLTEVQTYYATLYQGTNVSSMKALSVYSAVENISMAIGPVIFSYILANDIATGMRIFAYVSLACLVIFLVLTALKDVRIGTRQDNVRKLK